MAAVMNVSVLGSSSDEFTVKRSGISAPASFDGLPIRCGHVVHAAPRFRVLRSYFLRADDPDRLAREYVSKLWSEDWDSPDDDIYDTI